jgi:hypothetical protein
MMIGPSLGRADSGATTARATAARAGFLPADAAPAGERWASARGATTGILVLCFVDGGTRVRCAGTRTRERAWWRGEVGGMGVRRVWVRGGGEGTANKSGASSRVLLVSPSLEGGGGRVCSSAREGGAGWAREGAPAFAIHTGECLECTPMPLDGARGRQRAGAGSARRPKATDGPEGVRTLRVAPEGDKPSALYCVRGRPPLRGARHGTHPNALPTDQLHWRASVASPMCGTTEKGGVGRDTQKNTQSTRTPPLKDKPP